MKSQAWALVAVLGFLFTSVGFAGSPATCPDGGIGETAEDCPWGGMARELQQVSAEGGNLVRALSEIAPGIARQLEIDSTRPAVLSLWGSSINFDEGAHGIIVEENLLNSLFRLAGVPGLQGRIAPHAGFEHTYGYLFSTLKTSFGFKRARWVQGEFEAGFGLPAGTFGPTPSEGTLLGNVTNFFGRIALRTDDNAMATLGGDRADQVPAAIRDYDFGTLTITRLTETVTLPDTDGMGPREIELRTDFVPFANQVALVYSVRDSLVPSAQLITAFPVEPSFMTNALNPANLGDLKPVQTRYNAYVQSLTGRQGVTGLRRVFTRPGARRPS